MYYKKEGEIAVYLKRENHTTCVMSSKGELIAYTKSEFRINESKQLDMAMDVISVSDEVVYLMGDLPKAARYLWRNESIFA